MVSKLTAQGLWTTAMLGGLGVAVAVLARFKRTAEMLAVLAAGGSAMVMSWWVCGPGGESRSYLSTSTDAKTPRQNPRDRLEELRKMSLRTSGASSTAGTSGAASGSATATSERQRQVNELGSKALMAIEKDIKDGSDNEEIVKSLLDNLLRYNKLQELRGPAELPGRLEIRFDSSAKQTEAYFIYKSLKCGKVPLTDKMLPPIVSKAREVYAAFGSKPWDDSKADEICKIVV